MSSLGFFSFPDPRKSSYSHIHCGVTNTERASRRKKGKYKHTFTYTQTIRLKSVIFTLAFKNVKKKKKEQIVSWALNILSSTSNLIPSK